MKIITIIATAAAFVSFGAAATAQPVSTSVRVNYADLNLASSSGKATLAKRIDNAADRACAVDANQRDLAMKANSAHCRTAAVSNANIAIAQAAAPVMASR